MYRNGWVENGLVSLIAIVGFCGCNSSKTETPPPAAAQSSSSTPSPSLSPAPAVPPPKSETFAPQIGAQPSADDEEQSRALANDLFAPPADSEFNPSGGVGADGLGAGGVGNPFESLANAFGAVGKTIAGDDSDSAASEDGKSSFTGSLRKALRKGMVDAGSEGARTAQRDDSPQTN